MDAIVRIFSQWWLLLILLLLTGVAANDYIYREMEEEHYKPIFDYVPPTSKETPNGCGGKELLEPGFLFCRDKPDNPYKNPILVEFYAPWCPHCQHFAPKFVKFARHMLEIFEPYGVRMDFYAVSCTVNKVLCSHQDIKGYPTLKLFQSGSLNSTSVNYFDLHPFQLLRDIGIQVEAEDMAAMLPDQEHDNKHTKTFHLKKMNGRSKKDLYGDAYRSFHFAMKNGVYMTNGPLANKTATVLYDWLELLTATLPPTWNIQPLIRELLDNFNKLSVNEDHLLEILDKHPPDSEDFTLSCTHGEKAMGYTCGLWELFHIMTVGLVEYNSQVVGDDGYGYYTTAHVADILRDYISNFFGCEVCRLNFLNAYDACEFDRCNKLPVWIGESHDWMQLPLWLFQTHNSVNVRLMKEQAEREKRTPTHQDEIDVVWPPRLECPKCWKSDGSWDEDLVYKFLRLEYWPDDAYSKSVDRRMFELPLDTAVLEIEEEPSSFSRLFKVTSVVVVCLLVGYFYKKKADVAKTGRHKKIDVDV